MKKERARIRKKGDYYALDKISNGEVIKSWTLNPRKLVKIYECPKEKIDKVSRKEVGIDEIEDQNYAQSLLTVLLKMDKNLT